MLDRAVQKQGGSDEQSTASWTVRSRRKAQISRAKASVSRIVAALSRHVARQPAGRGHCHARCRGGVAVTALNPLNLRPAPPTAPVEPRVNPATTSARPLSHNEGRGVGHLLTLRPGKKRSGRRGHTIPRSMTQKRTVLVGSGRLIPRTKPATAKQRGDRKRARKRFRRAIGNSRRIEVTARSTPVIEWTRFGDEVFWDRAERPVTQGDRPRSWAAEERHRGSVPEPASQSSRP